MALVTATLGPVSLWTLIVSAPAVVASSSGPTDVSTSFQPAYLSFGTATALIAAGCATLLALVSVRLSARRPHEAHLTAAAVAADASDNLSQPLPAPKALPMALTLKTKAREVATFRACPGKEPCLVSSTTTQLIDLYNNLVAAFQHEKALGFAIHHRQDKASFDRLNGRVQSLMSQYAATASDWLAYAHFNDLHYVRNLVETNNDFELIVICWRQGQVSRVHNHGRSHCWLTVLQGAMTEIKYHDPDGLGVKSPRATEADSAPNIPGVITAVSPCPHLDELGSTEMHRGDVSYISDLIALHAVRCSERCPAELEGGVTLHLYSPPIRRVTLYEPDLDRVVERIPGFFTVKGRRTTVE